MGTGEDAPASVMAMGNRAAGLKDNREIPTRGKRLDPIQRCLGYLFAINANGEPGACPVCELEIRGTSVHIYTGRV